MFSRLSYRTRLVVMTSAITGETLLLAGALIVAGQLVEMRDAAVLSVTTQADVVAASCSAALELEDAGAAQRALLTLEADPNVDAACIRTPDGRVFAEFVRDGSIDARPDRVDEPLFRDRMLYVTRPVAAEGGSVGAVSLRYDTSFLYAHAGRSLRTLGLAIAGALVVSFLLAWRMYRRITRPLIELAGAARRVRDEEDYTVRARKYSADELGLLTDSFNEMLECIQSRDNALEKAHLELEEEARTHLNELERRVESRTLELSEANERLEAEISERRAIETQLRRHAYHDPLTGLANRSLLTDRLERCAARAARDGSFRYAVLFLDIDNFKIINDSLGHEMGDELLVAVTSRLQSCLRTVDAVVRRQENMAARLGGDEFVLLLEDLRKPTDAAIVCERLMKMLSEPFDLEGNEVVITASIGVALSDGASTDAGTMLRDADIAMYRAKEGGKARYALFDSTMHVEALVRLRMEGDLRRAVEQEEFRLMFQPIVGLATGGIKGFEALLRWPHRERGDVPPDQFIPVAEETGLIVPIGTWVLRAACRQLKAWDDAGLAELDLSMNINVSRRQLLEPGLLDEVARTLRETGLEARRVNLEITESAIIEDADRAAHCLEELRRLGVGIHMDDFGTGYSSLSCLHRFPLDVVKIDRAFMATMVEDRNYVAVVHGIITITHNLDMQVTAEGVETREQLAQILSLDCDFAQGYLFSRPLGSAEAEQACREAPRWRIPA